MDNVRNQEIQHPVFALDARGNAANPGFAFTPLISYNRKDIQAPAWRIKEWDYFLVQNTKFGFACTISNLGFARMISASFLNFEKGKETTKTIMLPPDKKWQMPLDSSNGLVELKGSGITLEYRLENEVRHLDLRIEGFYKRTPLLARLTFTPISEASMNILTPFDKPHQFYLNRKHNCLKVSGEVSYNYHMYSFLEQDDLGVLDWGRGVWPYSVHWYWGTGSGYINKKPFGFNVGYGFGNTQAASENMVFWNGKAWKLDDVTINMEKDPMEPWKITSSDGGFEGTFTPRLDRSATLDYVVIASKQHQYFGSFTGRVQTGKNEFLDVQDFPCAFEDIYNKY